MNDRSKLIFRIGTAISGCLAVLAAVFYAISYSTAYDTAIRQFNDFAGVTVFKALFIASVVTLSVTAIALCRRGRLREKAPNQIESFILWLTAFMFISFGIISMPDSLSVLSASGEGAVPFGSVCAAASAPLAALSAIPFVCAVSNRLRGSVLHGVTSFIPVLWGAALMFKYYFDLSEMPLNDPELAVTSACIAAMIFFFLSESRSAIGINTPAIAAFCNLSVTALTGCVSTARIVLGITSGHSIPSLMENIVFFTVSALAVTRLISFEAKLPELIAPETDLDSLYPESIDKE